MPEWVGLADSWRSFVVNRDLDRDVDVEEADICGHLRTSEQ